MYDFCSIIAMIGSWSDSGHCELPGLLTNLCWGFCNLMEQVLCEAAPVGLLVLYEELHVPLPVTVHCPVCKLGSCFFLRMMCDSV